MLFTLCFTLFTLAWAQVKVQDLPVETVVHGTAHLEQWNFYKFVVPGSNGFVLRVNHASKHDLDVYIAKADGTLPRFVALYYFTHLQFHPLLVQGHQLQPQHHC